MTDQTTSTIPVQSMTATLASSPTNERWRFTVVDVSRWRTVQVVDDSGS